ncbi:hypothetical protein NB721_002277 [Xanthomonas sacchari]|nr:hypothetical protein [Xanthomonas sacchari]
MEVGKAGAALGVKAAGDAISGGLSGDTEHIGAQAEAQADKIKQAALKICDQVAALRAAQDALMQKVPALGAPPGARSPRAPAGAGRWPGRPCGRGAAGGALRSGFGAGLKPRPSNCSRRVSLIGTASVGSGDQ